MQQSFTHEFMICNAGCYVSGEDTSQLMKASFMRKETVLLVDILTSEIPLRDKYWFVCRKLATKEQNQQIAITVAEIVLPIYEKKHPGNNAPREAIKAAKDYIAGYITLDQLVAKRMAAAAAAAAAGFKQQLLDYLLTSVEAA